MPSQIHLLRRLIRLISHSLPLRSTPMVAPLTSIIKPYSTVTFDRQKGKWWVRSTNKKTVRSGCVVTKPKNPTNVGLAFVNWYTDEKLTIPFDFTTPITTNITLYAGWSVTWRTATLGEYHTVNIQTDGTLWAWGYNYYEGLGLGDEDNRYSPKQIGTNKWKAGDNTVGIKKDGTPFAWGYNKHGQLGTGDTTQYTTPQQLQQLGTDTWKAVDAGAWHTVGIQTDGTLWTWGYNRYGQLGTGDEDNRYSPKQIGTNKWKAAAAGYWHTVGIRDDGTPFTWGYNKHGQLGTGDTTQYTTPKQLQQLGTDTWKAAAAGYWHTVGIRNDGTPFTWGKNDNGQLGTGDTTQYTTPKQLQQLGTDTWKAVDAGAWHTVGIQTDGTLWTWGYNRYGQLGLGDDKPRTSPTVVLEAPTTP